MNFLKRLFLSKAQLAELEQEHAEYLFHQKINQGEPEALAVRYVSTIIAIMGDTDKDVWEIRRSDPLLPLNLESRWKPDQPGYISPPPLDALLKRIKTMCPPTAETQNDYAISKTTLFKVQLGSDMVESSVTCFYNDSADLCCRIAMKKKLSAAQLPTLRDS